MTPLRSAVALTFPLLLARVLVACASNDVSPSSDVASDAGADSTGPARASCGISGQCMAHNHVCVLERSGGTCAAPPLRGLCSPTRSSTPEASDCYPDAVCAPVPRELSSEGGMCTFGNAPGEVFQLPGVDKIALIGPTQFNEYPQTQPITFRWMPPSRQSTDTIAVAVLLKRPPLRDTFSNRLRNVEDIVWIWSSTDPRGAAAGAVSLRAGHRGLRADGSLGPAFETDTLPTGRYWWMTYTLRDGIVRASSDAVTFRVGDDILDRPCSNVSQCIALIPGETSDRVACVYGRCKRRCASDLDCPGARQRCALDVTLEASSDASSTSIPRGAYCMLRD